MRPRNSCPRCCRRRVIYKCASCGWEDPKAPKRDSGYHQRFVDTSSADVQQRTQQARERMLDELADDPTGPPRLYLVDRLAKGDLPSSHVDNNSFVCGVWFGEVVVLKPETKTDQWAVGRLTNFFPEPLEDVLRPNQRLLVEALLAVPDTDLFLFRTLSECLDFISDLIQIRLDGLLDTDYRRV